MSSSLCGRCGAARDLQDNFCRVCGHQFTVNLPTPSAPALPVKSVPLPPSLIGGVAVLALSTGLEWMMRRMANNAVRRAGRALIGPAPSQSPIRPERRAAPDVTVDEVLYVRKVQLRR
jgi:hypothetical protein